jgi:hypothetical protein
MNMAGAIPGEYLLPVKFSDHFFISGNLLRSSFSLNL